ncbi:MAG: prephenate dehydrogenase, partial [Methanosarcinales archaeon]|nr:prephenate dehydrogenase [Methanosarcinales archaeon]
VHLYTGMVHIGVLKKLSPVDIVLENGKKDVSLKLANIKLMTDAELRQWKAENIILRMRDVSAFIPDGAKPDVICSVIECVDDVVSVELLDVYERNGDTSITVRIGIMGDVDAEGVVVSVCEMLEGVGCRIR